MSFNNFDLVELTEDYSPQQSQWQIREVEQSRTPEERLVSAFLKNTSDAEEASAVGQSLDDSPVDVLYRDATCALNDVSHPTHCVQTSPDEIGDTEEESSLEWADDVGSTTACIFTQSKVGPPGSVVLPASCTKRASPYQILSVLNKTLKAGTRVLVLRKSLNDADTMEVDIGDEYRHNTFSIPKSKLKKVSEDDTEKHDTMRDEWKKDLEKRCRHSFPGVYDVGTNVDLSKHSPLYKKMVNLYKKKIDSKFPDDGTIRLISAGMDTDRIIDGIEDFASLAYVKVKVDVEGSFFGPRIPFAAIEPEYLRAIPGATCNESCEAVAEFLEQVCVSAPWTSPPSAADRRHVRSLFEKNITDINLRGDELFRKVHSAVTDTFLRRLPAPGGPKWSKFWEMEGFLNEFLKYVKDTQHVLSKIEDFDQFHPDILNCLHDNKLDITKRTQLVKDVDVIIKLKNLDWSKKYIVSINEKIMEQLIAALPCPINLLQEKMKGARPHAVQAAITRYLDTIDWLAGLWVMVTPVMERLALRSSLGAAAPPRPPRLAGEEDEIKSWLDGNRDIGSSPPALDLAAVTRKQLSEWKHGDTELYLVALYLSHQSAVTIVVNADGSISRSPWERGQRDVDEAATDVAVAPVSTSDPVVASVENTAELSQTSSDLVSVTPSEGPKLTKEEDIQERRRQLLARGNDDPVFLEAKNKPAAINNLGGGATRLTRRKKNKKKTHKRKTHKRKIHKRKTHKRKMKKTHKRSMKKRR